MITRESLLDIIIESAAGLARVAVKRPDCTGYKNARDAFLAHVQLMVDKINSAELRRSDLEVLVASTLVFMAEGQLLATAQNTDRPVVPQEGAVLS